MSIEAHGGTWRAMGSAVDVVIVGAPAELLDLAKAAIDHLERRWSRFLPGSDISRLNHAAGSPVHIDPATVVLLQAMLDGWRVSDGAFDPTLLAPLVGLGYAASWHDSAKVTSLPGNARQRAALDELLIDGNVVVAPAGTCLDPGGIGKGLAADLVARRLLEAGARGASVSIGGDVSVRGAAPQPEGWLIGIADPLSTADVPGEVGQLAVLEGGVATSGTLRRSWRGADGSMVHHLLDPATGLPAHHARQLVSVTVIAGTAAWAEVWTKAVMVGGEPMLAALDERGLGASITYDDGTWSTNEAWELFSTVDARGASSTSVQQRGDLAGDEVEMIEV